MLVPRPVERGHVRAEGPHVGVDVARQGVAEGRRGGDGGDERSPAVRPGGLHTKSRHGRGGAREHVAEPVRLRGRGHADRGAQQDGRRGGVHHQEPVAREPKDPLVRERV